MCDTDNCNSLCKPEDCKKIAISRRDDPNADIATYDCSANCKADGIKTALL